MTSSMRSSSVTIPSVPPYFVEHDGQVLPVAAHLAQGGEHLLRPGQRLHLTQVVADPAGAVAVPVPEDQVADVDEADHVVLTATDHRISRVW